MSAQNQSPSRSPVRRPLAGVLLACVSLLGPLARAQQAPEQKPQRPVFHTEVEMTRIKVAVIDDEGEPVAGLTADDFRVFEDGKQQSVLLVLDPVRVSMDVALVLDFSQSVARDWSATAAREAARSFLESLAPGDCVYLLPFHQRVGPGLWGAPGDDELRWKIAQYSFGVYTRLYDAILNAQGALDRRRPDSAPAATEELESMMGGTWMEPVREAACGDPLSPEEALERRAALVVLTDGEDVGSRASYSDALMASWRAGVPVFAIAVGMAAEKPRRPSARGLLRSGPIARQLSRQRWENTRNLQDQLREIARVSGGQLVLQRDLGQGYAETLALLRSYYVVAYRSPETTQDGWHELQVEIAGKAGHPIVQPGIYRSRSDDAAAAGALREAGVQFALGNYEGALEQFDVAVRTSPHLGAPFFGRGLVLEKMARWEEARVSYQRSLQMRPGAPATHSRLAEVLFHLRDYAPAWEHGIKAHRGGVDMSPLFENLESVSEPPADRAARMLGPVIYLLQPRVPELEAQIALRDVTRTLTASLDRDPMIGLSGTAATSDFTISVWVRAVDDGRPRRMRARLVVTDRHDGRTHQQAFEVPDLEDPAVVAVAVQDSVSGVLKWILDRHRKRR